MTKFKSLVVAHLILAIISCKDQQNPIPKPRGYKRIEFKKKSYIAFTNSEDCPFSFLIPNYADVRPDTTDNSRPCWINVNYPEYEGTLHISFWQVENQKKLIKLSEESRKMVFKHTIRASEINEKAIASKNYNWVGFIYYIEGNAASPVQFFISNNKDKFLRAALYFNRAPNINYMEPIIEYIKLDIDKMIESFNWCSSCISTAK